MPGLAFDARGGRLGHERMGATRTMSRGHYDRLLARAGAPGLFKVGLAFDFQVVAAVPMAMHDVRMGAVATESGVLRADRPATQMDNGGRHSGMPRE